MIYTKQTYDTLIRKSYNYSQAMQKVNPDWGVVRSLYANNYISQAYLSNIPKQKIPKKIHQIWLGSPLPDKYKKYTESWQKYHPTWEYKLWTDKDINDVKITRRDIFDNAVNQGMKSDILRYDILRQYGGIYADTDFECLKSFDELLHLDFFIGIAYDLKMVLYNGLMASVPNHPIMNAIVNLKKLYDGNKGSVIMDVTGAYHVTRKFLKGVTKDTKGVVAFPMAFFYPLPNNDINADNPYKYIHESSYAMHHWAISWRKVKENG